MSENDNNLPAAKTDVQPLQGLSMEDSRQLRQFYVLHARRVIKRLPAVYSDDKCLMVLRKHVKRLIRALSALSSVINQKTDNEHFQREIIRNRRYIRQALKYYRHLLNDLENLKPQSPENRKSSTCLKRLRDKLISIFTKLPGIYQNPEPKKERR